MSDIQALVDALAAELRRPIGVDDQNFRSIAYSSHPEGVDPVRLASILQREAPRPVRDWLESLGVRGAEGYVRVPANPELGMAARVCVPLHFDRTPLGYLWLIDEPERLTAEELREAGQYAEEFGVALYRERLLERDDRRRERELVAEVLGLREGDPAAAAAELLRVGHLARAAGYAVLTLSVVGEGGGEPPDSIAVRLVDAAEQVRRAVAPHHLFVLVDGHEVVVALACASPEELERRAAALAEAAAEHLGDAEPWRVLVGVGEEHASPTELVQSFGEARSAAHVARAIGADGPLARWAELGAYRTVVRVLGERDPRELLPESFRRLLASRDGPTLAGTLECYLDLAGDARSAATALFIHRSTLYGRLHRIEEVAGVDLHSGEDRLELHLALRLWRLAEGRSGE